jgi:hypothetical protein
MNNFKLIDFLEDLQDDYSIIKIEGALNVGYKTLYYDTTDLKLYIAHHNGKLNRLKFRTREYLINNHIFDEVKRKTNRGKTIKTRQSSTEFVENMKSSKTEFFSRETKFDVSKLVPTLYIYYDRITLVHKKGTERVTIDTNLHYKFNQNLVTPFNNLVVVEIKHERGSPKSRATKSLDKLRCRKMGFSKYCMGIVTSIDGVKKNRFKSKLREIDKIISNK